MCEDDGLLYDIESNWFFSEGMNRIQVYAHKDYKNLLRIIDFEGGNVIFSDRKRIDKVIDINKALPEPRKSVLMLQLMRVMDAEKPIKMPYKPEKLKLYIEDLGEYVGVLYYMDSDEEKSIIPIKRYFRHVRGIIFTETTFENYYKYKEELESVNSNSEQTENSQL